MKVLILSSYAPTLFYFRKEMMLAIKEKGHEVIACAPDSQNEWESKFSEVGIKYLQINNIDRTGKNPIKDLKGFLSLLKLINKIKPQKIFTYQAKTIIYGAYAGYLVGVKEIYVMMGGLGSVFRSTKGFDFIQKIMLLQYKLAFSLSKTVFYQNDDDYQELINTKVVSKRKLVKVNGSGVNMEKFASKEINSYNNFLFVGRLIKDKGIYEYLEAAKIVKKEYPRTSFKVIGYFDTNPSAMDKDEFYKYVREGIIDYVGHTDDVYPHLKNSTVFVLPSYHEGTPKSVLEAMAVGRAIITSDAPGCRETVVDEYNGFLVPVKDVNKLAEKMIYFVNNKEKTIEFGLNSLKYCKEKFDVNKVNQTILRTMGIQN